MDDTRLLELAGLAAGEQYGPERNPLDRDDLALRLAVKLHIGSQCWVGSSGEGYALASFEHREGSEQVEAISPGSDPYAATRRAIVRAAAAIGQEGQKA